MVDYDASTLQVIDVSTPSAPTLLATVSTGSQSNPKSVAVAGRYAYVANYGDNSLQEFDLGGAYVQQLEAGTVETGTLQTRDAVTVGDNFNVRGGLTVSESARISGGLSVDNGTITAANVAASNITGANITATSFSGNGAGLVNVPASGLSGGITTNIVIDRHTFYYTNGVLINIQ